MKKLFFASAMFFVINISVAQTTTETKLSDGTKITRTDNKDGTHTTKETKENPPKEGETIHKETDGKGGSFEQKSGGETKSSDGGSKPNRREE